MYSYCFKHLGYQQGLLTFVEKSSGHSNMPAVGTVGVGSPWGEGRGRSSQLLRGRTFLASLFCVFRIKTRNTSASQGRGGAAGTHHPRINLWPPDRVSRRCVCPPPSTNPQAGFFCPTQPYLCTVPHSFKVTVFPLPFSCGGEWGGGEAGHVEGG